MIKIIFILKKIWEVIINSKIIQYAIMFFFIFAAGKRTAKQQHKAKQLEKEVKEIQKAMEQKDEAEKLSNSLDDTTIDQRMRKSGWLRD